MHVFADWYVHTHSFAGDGDAYFSMFDVLCIVWQVRPAKQPRAQRHDLPISQVRLVWASCNKGSMNWAGARSRAHAKSMKSRSADAYCWERNGWNITSTVWNVDCQVHMVCKFVKTTGIPRYCFLKKKVFFSKSMFFLTGSTFFRVFEALGTLPLILIYVFNYYVILCCVLGLEARFWSQRMHAHTMAASTNQSTW